MSPPYYFFLLICTTVYLVSCQNDQQKLYFRRDYKMLDAFNAFYKFHNTRLNFSDAVATCNAEGAHLWYPTSLEESEAVFVMINKTNIPHIWIGAHDLFSESVFITLSGTPVDEVYNNWHDGEPNNADNNEHCAAMGRSLTFNDLNCDQKSHFVCKRDVANLTQNPICETYDTAYNYNIDLNKCFKLHKTPMKWRDAFRVCRAESSQLTVLNSDVEARYLVGELSKLQWNNFKGNFDKGQVHVGFNDMINHGIYLTIEGIPLSESGYEKWAPNQPDNSLGNEHCGGMFRDGLLNDLNCDTVRAMFFCERSLSDSQFQEPSRKIKLSSASSGIVLLPDSDK